MINEVYYSGGGPPFTPAGLQTSSTRTGPRPASAAIDGHPWNGVAGGRRIGARAGIVTAAALSANPSLASPPTLSRATDRGCDAAALAAPCFDIGSTYAATATTTSISGSVADLQRP